MTHLQTCKVVMAHRNKVPLQVYDRQGDEWFDYCTLKRVPLLLLLKYISRGETFRVKPKK
jgi:hypothetical protein